MKTKDIKKKRQGSKHTKNIPKKKKEGSLTEKRKALSEAPYKQTAECRGLLASDSNGGGVSRQKKHGSPRCPKVINTDPTRGGKGH